MMTFLNEAGSCLSLILRFCIMIGGTYVISVTGWDRISNDPLYALVVLIFWYLAFTFDTKSKDET